MSNRTGAEHEARRKLFLRMTFFSPPQHQGGNLNRSRGDDPFGSRIHDNPCGLRVGGAGRDRTDDILLAKQALSQLSYGP